MAGAANSISKSSGSGNTTAQANAAGQQATDYAQQAANLYNNLKAPTFDRTALQNQTWLKDFVPQTYDPYIGQVSQVTDDPASIAAEQQSLGRLQALGSGNNDDLASIAAENQSLQQLQTLAKGGLTPSDMIALQQLEQSQAGAASSQGRAASDALRSRGLGGAGAEYAAQLAANQNASNSASSLYDNAMKAAMDRQTQAINASGTLAGNMRNQAYSYLANQLQANNSAGTLAGNMRNQADTVSAKMADINNAFNAQVQQLRTQAAANAAAVNNSANAANLAGRQGVANANVTTANQNVANQNQINQQDFANQSSIVSGQSNALNRQQSLQSAQQAALNQQALGQDQSLTTGLNGLTSLAKTLAPPTTGTSGSGSSGLQTLWNSLTGSQPPYSSVDPTNQSVAPLSYYDPNAGYQV